MSYEDLKDELNELIDEYYRDGTPIDDIRAAIRVADIMAEKLGAFELLEVAREMAKVDR